MTAWLVRKLMPAIFVSESEAELFRKRAPELTEKILAIPNGVDTAYFSPANAGAKPNFRDAPNLVFTGQMDYWPNVDAVIWFSDTVLPTLRERFSGATFYIVGAHPSAAVRALSARPGIVVTGAVPDVRPYVGHSDVVVAPMRIGRGVQNKVLEGMAMGRPVIATPQSLQGIDAEPNVDLLLAIDPEDFIAAVVRALETDFAKALGAAGRQRVVERYNWMHSLAQYDRLLYERP